MKPGFQGIAAETSRNGPVRYFQQPVTITFEKPCQRVLFNTARDANPFFHVFEALWMLAGRNDLDPLLKYVSTFGDFSDDGKTLNGAYGYRWRKHEGKFNDRLWDTSTGEELHTRDQLDLLVEHLKEFPNSRRAVLQMWNVEDDLLKVNNSLDVCCNLSACFAIRNGPETQTVFAWKDVNKLREKYGVEKFNEEQLKELEDTCTDTIQMKTPYLDMTVFNRSNDMVWGTCGANAVHFSFLQEYMAKRLGVGVGVYNQISNNLHVYTETNWKPEKWLSEEKKFSYMQDVKISVPFVLDPETFDKEVKEFIDNNDWSRSWKEPFLHRVAAPMMWAFELHRRRNYLTALQSCNEIEDDAWRISATNWITKRRDKYESCK
tara:strand:+ start:3890 stop:5017 length:1128 start_codon:yes stop_codon:yes gene_type:complete